MLPSEAWARTLRHGVRFLFLKTCRLDFGRRLLGFLDFSGYFLAQNLSKIN